MGKFSYTYSVVNIETGKRILRPGEKGLALSLIEDANFAAGFEKYKVRQHRTANEV